MRSKLSNLLSPPCPFLCLTLADSRRKQGKKKEEKQGKEKIPEKKRKGEESGGEEVKQRRETKRKLIYLNLFLEGRIENFPAITRSNRKDVVGVGGRKV